MGLSGALTKDEKETIAFQMNEIESLIKDTDYQYEFFRSVQDQFVEKDWLSDKQIASLDRMYMRVTDV